MAPDENGHEPTLVDLSVLPKPANDSYPVFERLKAYAKRGTDSPESLSLYEIRQVSFALTLYLDFDEHR